MNDNALRERASDTSRPPFDLKAAIAGEFLGTFILVFFGVGSVNAAVATGAQAGLWQVAVVWAIGVSLAIYSSASLSGAHLNPAITITAAVYDGFSWRRAGVYIASQVAGAIAASVVLYIMFAEPIAAFERAKGLVRGSPGSELSAMMFGEYFPNPAVYGTTAAHFQIVSLKGAFVAEMIGTAMLAFLVGSLTSEKNMARPNSAFAAVMIGLGVAAIISLIAPLTQAGLNPARDFGPRLVSWFMGWGAIAIPGPRGGWFTVYILAPVVGALIGGGMQRYVASMMKRNVAGGS
jgi:glycerol uptake facilitator protein